MNFYGKTFYFNNIPCDAFDLMLYDIDGGGESEGEYASPVSIEEEAVGSRWKPYFYGVKYEERLTFDITFGVNTSRIDENRLLDRYETTAIADWLTGHDHYINLDIEQEDMKFVRYKAIITKLEMVTFGQIPYALKATVECDSPFAYMYPEENTFTITTSGTASIYNRSSLNGYYMPVITLSQSGGTFSIVNTSDANREFKFTSLPGGTGLITVQNDNCLIKCANGLNLYPYFNNQFFRLVKGNNALTITGTGTLKIICEFPINIGG